jgi:hypothetical protein
MQRKFWERNYIGVKISVILNNIGKQQFADLY